MYRKPTITDTINPNDSCHPKEHKRAAIRCLANRMETYNLNATNKEKENTTKQILYNNTYDTSILKTFTPVENKTRPDRKNSTKTKWAKFTYIGRETKFITKHFKNTNHKITFTTQNTIDKYLSKQKNS
jgi:hypothetical protein